MHTIAIVDDNADNILLLKILLGDHYQVFTFDSGVKALESFKSAPPELVLMDISLPVMDGIAALKIMRADPLLKSIPVIALTAHAMRGDREVYLAHGFNDYFSKPILDVSILIEMIERLLT